MGLKMVGFGLPAWLGGNRRLWCV